MINSIFIEMMNAMKWLKKWKNCVKCSLIYRIKKTEKFIFIQMIAKFTMRMKMNNAKITNKMIKKNIACGHEWKKCVRTARIFLIKQCYNCHHYEHKTKTCKNKTTCKWYAENHDTKACKMKMNDCHMKCVMCEKEHAVWSDICLIKKKSKKIQNKNGGNGEIVFHFHKHTQSKSKQRVWNEKMKTHFHEI